MRGLLEAVAHHLEHNSESSQKNGWNIRPIPTGTNGLVFQAVSENLEQADLAVKISKQDNLRKRSEREYAATFALWKRGLDVCPYPIYLDQEPENLPGSVVISQWLSGNPLQNAPSEENTQQWRQILETLVQVHLFTRRDSMVTLRNAIFPIRHPIHLIEILQQRLQQLPEGKSGELTYTHIENVVHKVISNVPEYWQKQAISGLILCDTNPNNMIDDTDKIRFVDWENSGWADPAFDIGDMLAQPAYFALSNSHREWIRETYAVLIADTFAIGRIQIYEQLMNVFWLIVMSTRLVKPPQNRLQGVHQYSEEHLAKHQQLYWQRINNFLS